MFLTAKELNELPKKLNARQKAILLYDQIDREEYCKLYNVSNPTAARDLDGLVKMGICKRVKRSKAYKYIINNR